MNVNSPFPATSSESRTLHAASFIIAGRGGILFYKTMSYFDESDARRDARRDYDRGRCDREMYERHSWDAAKEAYTEEWNNAKREEERRQERLEEEREQERREEAARERRRHEAEMERQQQEEEYYRQQQEAYEQQQSETPEIDSPNNP